VRKKSENLPLEMQAVGWGHGKKRLNRPIREKEKSEESANQTGEGKKGDHNEKIR